MTIPLTVRVGDEHVTRRIDNLSFTRNVNGDAECSFRLSRPLTSAVAPFTKVTVFDGRSADIVWEGRLEDPGRSIDEGQQWDMSAIGEQARAADRAAPLIYIDTDLGRWEREQLLRATSAEAGPSDLPSAEGTDCLLMQYPPGQPLDTTSTIVMVYREIERAGMTVGGIEWTEVAGQAFAAWEFRLFAKPPGVGSGTMLRNNPWSITPTARQATTTIPTDTSRVEFAVPRVSGGATNIGTDNAWAAFYGVVVKAARYNLDGSINVTNADYTAGRGVYPHEIVTDVLVRLLSAVYDVPVASIDTTSTYQIDQFAFPDGVTAEQVLAELTALEPNFYWQVGPSNPATGKSSFTWRKWPTSVRYEASLKDGLSLPGADAERYNRVTVRWTDKRGRSRTKVYNAGTTISGIFVPPVPELDAQGLIREPEPQDLGDEVGSQAAADKFAAEFLLAHGTPPVSGTLTVARRIYDADRGAYVEPWEIQPGHLIRIRELADSPQDLGATSRDGKATFRVVGVTYDSGGNAATLDLDAPPRTDQVLLAQQVKRRRRKR